MAVSLPIYRAPTTPMPILIIANGELTHPDWIRPYVSQATAVIAADGGANHLAALGLIPTALVGDCDSITANLLDDLRQRGVIIEQHPPAKNETDLELAFAYALRHYPTETIWLVGVIGDRLDHTVANILLLAHPMLAGHTVHLLDDQQSAWLVTAATDITGQAGDTVSLIPLGGSVHVAATTGLRWPLQNEWLPFGSPRGVSNELTSGRAHIRVHSGQLLCVHTRGEL